MRRDPVTAYIALGGNLGDARATVIKTFEALDCLPGTRLSGRSRLYRSAPLQADGPDFINAVASVRTHLSAPELLRALQHLELAAGRTRPYPNAPRTLDLDILLYGQARIDSPSLTVPHPRMWARAFVLRPLADVAPALVSEDQLVTVRDQALEPIEPDAAAG